MKTNTEESGTAAPRKKAATEPRAADALQDSECSAAQAGVSEAEPSKTGTLFVGINGCKTSILSIVARELQKKGAGKKIPLIIVDAPSDEGASDAVGTPTAKDADDPPENGH